MSLLNKGQLFCQHYIPPYFPVKILASEQKLCCMLSAVQDESAILLWLLTCRSQSASSKPWCSRVG